MIDDEHDESPLGWKSRFYEIQHDHKELSKAFNEKETSLRMLKTKYAKLEADFNKQNRYGPVRPYTSASLRVAERQELEDLLDDTQKKNRKILKEYRALDEKHKGALDAIEKNKREIGSLRRRLSGAIPCTSTRNFKQDKKHSGKPHPSHEECKKTTNRQQRALSLKEFMFKCSKQNADESQKEDELTNANLLENTSDEVSYRLFRPSHKRN